MTPIVDRIVSAFKCSGKPGHGSTHSFKRASSGARLPELRVVEGVEGMFRYHLATQDQMKAVCDPERRVMHTSIPLSTWGFRGHLKEKYCAQCEAEAARRGVALGDGLQSA